MFDGKKYKACAYARLSQEDTQESMDLFSKRVTHIPEERKHRSKRIIYSIRKCDVEPADGAAGGMYGIRHWIRIWPISVVMPEAFTAIESMLRHRRRYRVYRRSPAFRSPCNRRHRSSTGYRRSSATVSGHTSRRYLHTTNPS